MCVLCYFRFAIMAPTKAEDQISHAQRLGLCLESLFGKSLAGLGIGKRKQPILLGSFTTCDAGFVDGADRHQSFCVYYDTLIDPGSCFHIEGNLLRYLTIVSSFAVNRIGSTCFALTTVLYFSSLDVGNRCYYLPM